MSNGSSKSDNPKADDVAGKYFAVPWPVWRGAVGVIGWLLLSQVLASILFQAGLTLLNQLGGPLQGDQTSVGQRFTLVFLVETIGIAGILWFARSYTGSRKLLGLTRPKLSDGWLVAGLFVLYICVLAVLERLVPLLLPIDVNQKQDLGFGGVHGAGALTLVFFSLVLLPPLAEELMMRGFLYGSLRGRLRPVYAALITSVVFAALHLPGGKVNSGPLWIAALDTFTLSLVLCYAREKTGRLWPCITLHALKNGLAFLALFVFHLA